MTISNWLKLQNIKLTKKEFLQELIFKKESAYQPLFQKFQKNLDSEQEKEITDYFVTKTGLTDIKVTTDNKGINIYDQQLAQSAILQYQGAKLNQYSLASINNNNSIIHLAYLGLTHQVNTYQTTISVTQCKNHPYYRQADFVRIPKQLSDQLQILNIIKTLNQIYQNNFKPTINLKLDLANFSQILTKKQMSYLRSFYHRYFHLNDNDNLLLHNSRSFEINPPIIQVTNTEATFKEELQCLYKYDPHYNYQKDTIKQQPRIDFELTTKDSPNLIIVNQNKSQKLPIKNLKADTTQLRFFSLHSPVETKKADRKPVPKKTNPKSVPTTTHISTNHVTRTKVQISHTDDYNNSQSVSSVIARHMKHTSKFNNRVVVTHK